ncbi:MAG: transporter substrate-binding domain-containing protein [Desulfobacteraceae bacterium]|nr:transporter substrate-binding domain-containing protein [Desulfobacteraceae bacterium]
MTEELRPFGYLENNRIKGVCVEIVREVLKMVDHPDNIAIYPWKRAYHDIQHNSNRILFSMGRNQAREPLFKWVGPLIANTTYFYKRRGSAIHIKSLDDARLVKRISVRENYFTHTLLKAEGFNNFELTRDGILDLRKLNQGRVDLIAQGELSLKSMCVKAGVDYQNIENTGVILFDSKMYMAFSKDTPDAEIEKWQTALDAVKQKPIFKKIVIKYIGTFPAEDKGRKFN